MRRSAHLWRLRPLPADRHQDVVGIGSRGSGGGAAGHCCGPAFHILAWRTLQVIITPTDHRCLTAWIQKNKETCRQKPWWVRESLKKRRSPSPLSQSMTQASQQLLLRQDFDRSGMTVKRSVFQYNNVNKFNSTWHSNCVKHLRKDNPAFLRLYPSV